MSVESGRGIGFQDLVKFNIALLAKQGWKLIDHPSSLIAHILKAKYFSNSDFLNARLGSNPSLIWRSIWSSRRLVEMGLSWRVGSRRMIDVWEDCWLQGSFPNRVVSPRVPQVSKVSDLMLKHDKFGIRSSLTRFLFLMRLYAYKVFLCLRFRGG